MSANLVLDPMNHGTSTQFLSGASPSALDLSCSSPAVYTLRVQRIPPSWQRPPSHPPDESYHSKWAVRKLIG